MLASIYKKLEHIANVQMLGVLVVVCLLCVAGFQMRTKALGLEENKETVKTPGSGFNLCAKPEPDRRIFDVRQCGYTPEEAAAFLAALGEDGRRLYAVTQLTLDVIFPFAYCGLLIILFIAYWRQRHLLLIPAVTAACDLMENVTTAYLAWSYDGSASSIASLASVFTIVKTVGLAVSGLLVIAGILLFLGRSLFFRVKKLK